MAILTNPVLSITGSEAKELQRRAAVSAGLIGLKASAEARAKMSLSQTGRKHTAESIQRMKKPHGPMSEETKQKLSVARTGSVKPAKVIAQMLETRRLNAVQRNLNAAPTELRDAYSEAYEYRRTTKVTTGTLAKMFGLKIDNLLIRLIKIACNEKAA